MGGGPIPMVGDVEVLGEVAIPEAAGVEVDFKTLSLDSISCYAREDLGLR